MNQEKVIILLHNIFIYACIALSIWGIGHGFYTVVIEKNLLVMLYGEGLIVSFIITIYLKHKIIELLIRDFKKTHKFDSTLNKMNIQKLYNLLKKAIPIILFIAFIIIIVCVLAEINIKQLHVAIQIISIFTGLTIFTNIFYEIHSGKSNLKKLLTLILLLFFLFPLYILAIPKEMDKFKIYNPVYTITQFYKENIQHHTPLQDREQPIQIQEKLTQDFFFNLSLGYEGVDSATLIKSYIVHANIQLDWLPRTENATGIIYWGENNNFTKVTLLKNGANDKDEGGRDLHYEYASIGRKEVRCEIWIHGELKKTVFKTITIKGG